MFLICCCQINSEYKDSGVVTQFVAQKNLWPTRPKLWPSNSGAGAGKERERVRKGRELEENGKGGARTGRE